MVWSSGLNLPNLHEIPIIEIWVTAATEFCCFCCLGPVESAAMRTLLAVVLLTACSPSDRDNPAADGPSQPDTSPDTGNPVDTSKVYAHSGQMLYRLNNATLAATPIGPMMLADNQSLLDLAVNKDDEIIGITRDKLYSISPTTGASTLVKDLSASATGFTSLSFAPLDLDDPNSNEILVAANDEGTVFSISSVDGTATMLGSYGTDATLGQVISSGDLIAVRGFGIYATVDVNNDPDGIDYLARIDPVTWKATLIGPTGYNKIFGLGYWGGIIYGFVDDGFEAATGRVIQIDQVTGAGLDLGVADVRWFGAGVATDAPILE